MTQRKARQHPTRRLLLIAATGFGAGVASAILSLAVSDTAHAHDVTAPRLITPGLAVVDGAASPKVATSERIGGRPTPGHRIVKRKAQGLTQAADTTSRTIRKTTDRADRVTSPVPVVGDTVDTTTNVIDGVIDTDTASPPRLPGVGDTQLQLPAPRPAPDVEPSRTETAPEPVVAGPPTLLTTGSGAPHLVAAARQYPSARTAGTNDTTRPARAARATQPANPLTPASPPPGTGGWGEEPSTAVGAASHTHQVADSPANRSVAVDLWRQATTRYVQHHSGRTPPPTPPSG